MVTVSSMDALLLYNHHMHLRIVISVTLTFMYNNGFVLAWLDNYGGRQLKY